MLHIKIYVTYPAGTALGNGCKAGPGNSDSAHDHFPSTVSNRSSCSPLGRQEFSDFALTYMFLLRSRILMGVLSGTLASHFVGTVTNSRAPLLHEHYFASQLLRAQPRPSRLLPTSRCLRLYGVPAPPISRRDEEGFSSFSACPCHRAVATTPPECLAASIRLQRSMLPSSL